MKNEHIEEQEIDTNTATLEHTAERDTSIPAIIAKLAPLLATNNTFADTLFSRVYQFDQSAGGREDVVISDCLDVCNDSDRSKIMSLLETFSLETKMNYHKDENGAHQTSIAIADILFNNPAITRAIERGLTPSATMARLFPLLAHTNTSFANAIYARTYMIDPNCAGREDKLIQEYLNHCNDEDLEKIVNTLYEGITHESGNTIADIIFKNSH